MTDQQFTRPLEGQKYQCQQCRLQDGPGALWVLLGRYIWFCVYPNRFPLKTSKTETFIRDLPTSVEIVSYNSGINTVFFIQNCEIIMNTILGHTRKAAPEVNCCQSLYYSNIVLLVVELWELVWVICEKLQHNDRVHWQPHHSHVSLTEQRQNKVELQARGNHINPTCNYLHQGPGCVCLFVCLSVSRIMKSVLFAPYWVKECSRSRGRTQRSVQHSENKSLNIDQYQYVRFSIHMLYAWKYNTDLKNWVFGDFSALIFLHLSVWTRASACNMCVHACTCCVKVCVGGLPIKLWAASWLTRMIFSVTVMAC